MIVDEASADPGLIDVRPIPIDADHIKIAKPADRQQLQYSRTRDFVAENPPLEEAPTGYSIFPLPAVKLEQPWNFVPKLLRIALLVLVGLIAFKGIQALIASPATLNTGAIEKGLDAHNALTQESNALAQQGNELMRQWLKQKTTPIQPGEKEAVGKALAAAQKGASTGDERMKGALELLKSNKLVESEAPFHAVAADEAAKGQQNRKVAAAAYRNLGAISGLSDPKRSLEAYSTAVNLDPGDYETQFRIGWLKFYSGNLPEAQPHFQEVSESLAIPRDEWMRDMANIGMDYMKIEQGNPAGGLKYYRDRLSICEYLAKLDPNQLIWKRDLSICFRRIGDVLIGQGNLSDAVTAYNKGVYIAKRLAKEHRADPILQSDLASYLEVMGAIEILLGTQKDGPQVKQIEWYEPSSPSLNLGKSQPSQGSSFVTEPTVIWLLAPGFISWFFIKLFRRR